MRPISSITVDNPLFYYIILVIHAIVFITCWVFCEKPKDCETYHEVSFIVYVHSFSAKLREFLFFKY